MSDPPWETSSRMPIETLRGSVPPDGCPVRWHFQARRNFWSARSATCLRHTRAGSGDKEGQRREPFSCVLKIHPPAVKVNLLDGLAMDHYKVGVLPGHEISDGVRDAERHGAPECGQVQCFTERNADGIHGFVDLKEQGKRGAAGDVGAKRGVQAG